MTYSNLESSHNFNIISELNVISAIQCKEYCFSFNKDGDIPNDDDEYAVGIDGVREPLEEGDDQRCPCTSVPCKSAAERALTLRASSSQWAWLRV
jgi:hypothetical protein